LEKSEAVAGRRLGLFQSWFDTCPIRPPGRKGLADSPGRPQAIRRLLEQGLPGHSPAPAHSGGHKAFELAAKAIEGLADQSRPASEHARAKRRLIHGPKEFRDIRADQPKRRDSAKFT